MGHKNQEWLLKKYKQPSILHVLSCSASQNNSAQEGYPQLWSSLRENVEQKNLFHFIHTDHGRQNCPESILLHVFRTGDIIAHLSPLQDFTAKADLSGNDVTKWEKMRREGLTSINTKKLKSAASPLQMTLALVNKNPWNIYWRWPVRVVQNLCNCAFLEMEVVHTTQPVPLHQPRVRP